MDAHELIVRLKEMADTLGRTPIRDEFVKEVRNAIAHIKKAYGQDFTYSQFVSVAGLVPTAPRRIDNTIFKASIDRHIEMLPAVPAVLQEEHPTIASISDIHWPFSSDSVIKRFVEYCGDVKPEVVVINGDAWDMYSHTKFPRTHNLFTPREEQNRSREANEVFWRTIQLTTPQSKCYQLLGNHDVRPMKRILEAYPEAEDWVAQMLKQLFTFEGVTTLYDSREELIFGSIAIHHGYRSKLGDHRDFLHMNSINGHTHMGGVVFRRIKGSTLWELNSGLAGNPEAKGLTYTPQKITVWTPGFGVVNKNGPQFIPC